MDPIEIWIEDDDCDVLVGPRHGAILAGCGNQYGDRCVVECDVGHAPAGAVVLECEAGTGTWNGSVPSCEACLTGYFHMDTNGSCAACNASACGVGMYRGACGGSSDAACEGCTSKPANASYLTSGQPWDADNCTWQCDAGFWRSGESCVSCTTAACGAGQYRGECEAEADAACLQCNSGQLPKYSRFIASANASACKWSCDALYHLEHGECVSSISPEILVGAPSLARIKEWDSTSTVSVGLKVSFLPDEDVVVTVSTSSDQLSLIHI